MPQQRRPMPEPLRIALAGLGTVGTGVIRLVEQNRAMIAARSGRTIDIVAVSARERGKDRGVDLAPYAWADDMQAMARRADVDVVVELVGGSDGPALSLARTALGKGKGLVTANKAMVAHHGLELAQLAARSSAPFAFEAAVAGGIPVLKGLREGTAANALDRIYGILNGTCNFILSEMERTGADFDAMLADAQAKGFAEADPELDIEGVDAAHKLAILAAIGFGTRIDFASVRTEGITQVRAHDIAQADSLGYVIRLVGIATLTGKDETRRLSQRVRPCLLPFRHPLAAVTGPTNAVVAEGDFSGRLLFQGAGAGDKPTASAVVADLIDIARGQSGAPFSVPTDALTMCQPADPGTREGQHYIRFSVADRPGVLAEITAAMRDTGVSIESFIQRGRDAGGGQVQVAMVTHEGPEAHVSQALELLAGSPSLAAPPLVMPILKD